MQTRLYGLASCDSCRRALRALRDRGLEPEVIDIRADGVPSETLADWLARLGAETLVNRRSTTWRGLSEAERAGAETTAGAAALLAAHPTLIKRPVILAGGEIHVGWTPETEAALARAGAPG